MVDWTEHRSLARDMQRFQQALRPQFPEGVEIQSCELLSLRHVDDLSGEGADGLLACYRVSFIDTSTQAQCVQLYAGHIVTDARELFGAHAGRALATPVCGPPLIFLPEMDMVLFAFPNDARLLLLGDCVSREALDTCVAHATDFAGCTVVESAYEVLKYDPARACTLRFIAVLERNGVRRTHRLVAKTRIDGVAEHAENLKRLWEKLPLRSGNWTLARPHYYDADRRLSWESALDGEPFWSCYPKLAAAPIFEQMASAVADIHHSGAASKKKDAEPVLVPASEQLASLDPGLGARQTELLRWLGESQSSLKSADVLLHGDFHPEVFLIAGPRVSLAHFDHPHTGDPARDLGRFASHVYATAVVRGIDPTVFHEALEAFYAEYARCAAPWDDMRAVCWHVAAELAGRRVVEALPISGDAPPAISQLLALAEAHVKRMDIEEIRRAAIAAEAAKASDTAQASDRAQAANAAQALDPSQTAKSSQAPDPSQAPAPPTGAGSPEAS